MSQNKTRLWVGLAIVAVTIPTVGTFYTRSAAASGLVGNPISAAGRIDLVSKQDSPTSGQVALKEPLRDYQAEVSAALARQRGYSGQRLEGDATDDSFDEDPLDAEVDAYGTGSANDVPNANSVAGSGNPTVAYSTDGPVTAATPPPTGTVAASGAQASNDGQVAMNGGGTAATTDAQTGNAASNDALDDYGYGQGGSMSDSDVYRLVVNNLSPQRRDDFVQAYSAMSDQQRSALLDSFRQQIQSGP